MIAKGCFQKDPLLKLRMTLKGAAAMLATAPLSVESVNINNKPPSFLGGQLLLIIPLVLPYLNVSNGCKRVLF